MMQAIMLAAGIGARLSNSDETYPPKCLLKFAGKSLLARHIEILQANGIAKLHLVTGYRAAEIERELAEIGAGDFVATILNPDYRAGSLISLAAAAKILRGGADILFMDADVLYSPDLLQQLIAPPETSCLLYDPEFEPGDEPVKLCLQDNKIVEFRKIVGATYDTIGEWPGFAKWSAKAAQRIADITEQMFTEGPPELPYEEAFRDYLLSANSGEIICKNIAGIPWIEIDFPTDLDRAREVILPAISKTR